MTVICALKNTSQRCPKGHNISDDACIHIDQADAWHSEGRLVKQIVIQVAEDVAYNYELSSRLGVGGSVVVV